MLHHGRVAAVEEAQEGGREIVDAVEPDGLRRRPERDRRREAAVVERLERWVVMQAPTGQRFCVVRIQRPGFPKNANRWD